MFFYIFFSLSSRFLLCFLLSVGDALGKLACEPVQTWFGSHSQALLSYPLSFFQLFHFLSPKWRIWLPSLLNHRHWDSLLPPPPPKRPYATPFASPSMVRGLIQYFSNSGLGCVNPTITPSCSESLASEKSERGPFNVLNLLCSGSKSTTSKVNGLVLWLVF